MQIRAAAKYVGYPPVVTLQIIDTLRLGLQRGFWDAAQNIKSITAEGAEKSAENAEKIVTLQRLAL